MTRLFHPCKKTLILCLWSALPLTYLPANLVFQFQDGLDGYEGTADNRLSGRSSAGNQDQYNRGAATTFQVRNSTYNADGEYIGGSQNFSTSMLRFDDLFGTDPGQVDPDVEILSATLKITATSRTANTAARTIQFGAMMKPFVEGTANGTLEAGSTSMFWQYAPTSLQDPVETIEDGTPWSDYILAGPDSPNNRHYGGPQGHKDFYFEGDYHTSILIFEDGEHPGGTTTVSITEPHLFEVDITPMVIAWQQGDIPNYGIYLFHRGSGATNVIFASSLAEEEGFRPMLEIVAVPEPAAFGAMAGLGLVALYAWQRRRNPVASVVSGR